MKFAAWYAIVVGLLMLAQWLFFLLAGQVPELHSEPYRIGFHLAGEAVTAVTLILSGVGLLRHWRLARELAFLALGLLFYTVLVSPGYFAQQGQWALVGMFALLLLLGIVSLIVLVRETAVKPG